MTDDSIFTQALDTSIANLRLRVLKTPHRSPKANSLCERLIASLRRECLDWAIPLSEGHLRSLLKMLEHLLQPRTAPYGVRARRARSANRCAGAAAASSASPQREPSGGGQACIERGCTMTIGLRRVRLEFFSLSTTRMVNFRLFADHNTSQ